MGSPAPPRKLFAASEDRTSVRWQAEARSKQAAIAGTMSRREKTLELNMRSAIWANKFGCEFLESSCQEGSGQFATCQWGSQKWSRSLPKLSTCNSRPLPISGRSSSRSSIQVLL